LPPDDYQPVRHAERLTNAHVRGTYVNLMVQLKEILKAPFDYYFT
jgi:hypothetical protein